MHFVISFFSFLFFLWMDIGFVLEFFTLRIIGTLSCRGRVYYFFKKQNKMIWVCLKMKNNWLKRPTKKYCMCRYVVNLDIKVKKWVLQQNANSNIENKKCYRPIYLTYLMENLWPIDTNDNTKGKDCMVSIWIQYTSFLDSECCQCQISFKEFSTTLHLCSW